MTRQMTRTKTRAATVLTALALAALATASHADQGNKGHAKKAKNYHAASPATANCPPGLAKKNPPCVPPGQVRNRYEHQYRVGDRIDRDYIILRDPYRYRLDPNQTYYRVGDYLYHVDRETGKVLNFIGAAAALLQ